MMLVTSFKILLGTFVVFLTFAGYVPYLISIVRRQTKPHMFSWIVWGIVNGIAFAGQFLRGAGAGSWTTGVTSAICFVIVGFSVVWGEKHITRMDWIAFLAALTAIPLWYVTNDPLEAVIMATVIDGLGLVPTWRHSYQRPQDENAFTWGLIGIRSFLSLFALQSYSTITVLFPVMTTILNGGMGLMLIVRRHMIAKGRSHDRL